MHPAVTCSIPGGKRAAQVADNVAAADLPALSDSTMQALAAVYARFAKPLVHQRW
jgi:aryl-alcohol dehydrogenase-like predicted oxidoreductase